MAWLVTEGRVLASAEEAIDRRQRRRGLVGRDGIDGALVLTKCRWVHTLGMRFPIDVVYLDPVGTVVKTQRLVPNRVALPVFAARTVIEAETGALARWQLHLGDVVELRE